MIAITAAGLGLSAVTFATVYLRYPGFLVGAAQAPVRGLCGLKRKTLEVEGDRWTYLIGGPKSGEVVVLLHGFGADKDNWIFHARRLTKKYRVICPDLPGFGESARHPERDHGGDAQAARLDAFLSALGLTEEVHLGGNSMGGYISLKYALAYPKRLKSLTLFNSAGVTAKQKSELQLGIDEGKNLLAIREPADVDRVLAFAAHKPVKLPGAFKKVMYLKAKKHEAFLDAVFNKIAGEIGQAPLNDQLADIQTPALIIWGRQDRIIDVSCTENLAALPNHRCVILEETGHAPMVERPGKTAALQAEFFEALA